MKKVLAVILVLMLSCTTVLAIAEEYEPHISYTGSGWMLNTGANYDDAFYDFFSEKFNMDFIPYYTDKSTNDSTVSLLVNTSSMPDGLIMLSINYEAYLEWADQGLLKALPTGWEEKYPNMYQMICETGLLEKLTVDGELFIVPHVIWHNFVEMDTPVEHQMVFYRKDWAEKLGMSDLFANNMVKKSDLFNFCLKAVEANLGDNGYTVGLTATTAHMAKVFFNQLMYNYSTFNKTENGYQWGPRMDKMTDTIKYMREVYQSGALDPDFYLGNYLSTFESGAAAAMFANGTANSSQYVEDFINAHQVLVDELNALRAQDSSAMYYDTSAEDKYVGYAVLCEDNGETYERATSNYYSYTLFNPDIDDDVLDRILCMIDWMCTPDGEVTCKIGIPEVDWKWDVYGESIVQIPNAEGTYNAYDSKNMLTQYAVCSDEMALVKKTNSPTLISFVKKMYETKQAGNIIPFDIDYKFFTSQSKSEYSVDIDSQIVSLVVDSTLDIDTEWAKFLDEYAKVVDPLVKDLNAAFYPNL